MDLEVRGKTALITGSDRGTGRAIAQRFTEAGVRVVLHGNERLPEPLPGACDCVQGDLCSDDGAAAVVEQVRERVGDVDILVNNLGAAVRGDWTHFDLESWLASYARNTLSAVRMAHAWTPGMRQAGWGRVVQLATVGAYRPGDRMPQYYAAKAALASTSLSLAQALAGTGVTVNTVSPGLIRTLEVEASFRAKARRQGWGDDWDHIEALALADTHPNLIGRMARPEEVADLVLFLASNRAACITAQNIRIDGGALVHY
ncbi:MAG: SDR family oxidoreductase [Pseudomonadota bacterium]|nr:SDR family oxidoreductase [Pseudomonadota bacterium]